MVFKLKLFYPDGETEELDDEFDSWDDADSEGMEQANAFACGAEVLEDAGRDYMDGRLDWEVFEK